MSATCRQFDSWECFCFFAVSLSACSFPWGTVYADVSLCVACMQMKSQRLHCCVRERLLQPTWCYSHFEPNVIMLPRLCLNSDVAAEISYLFYSSEGSDCTEIDCCFDSCCSHVFGEASEWESEQQRGFEDQSDYVEWHPKLCFQVWNMKDVTLSASSEATVSHPPWKSLLKRPPEIKHSKRPLYASAHPLRPGAISGAFAE